MSFNNKVTTGNGLIVVGLREKRACGRLCWKRQKLLFVLLLTASPLRGSQPASVSLHCEAAMPATTLEPDLSTTLWATIWFALLPGSQQRLDLHSYMPSHSTLSLLLSSARPSANGSGGSTLRAGSNYAQVERRSEDSNM